MKWIKTSDIRNWPVKDARECQGESPILLRKLLLASTGRVTDLDIPGNNDLAFGGFDGYFELKEDIPFLKKGKYVVEVGTDHGIRKKADKDYVNSKSKPIKHVSSEVTFLFFTPRLFAKAEEWIKEKKEESNLYWKDIKIINAPILEQWLELTPSVGQWLAVDLNLVFGAEGVLSTTAWTERYLTKPNGTEISKQAILAGREGSRKEFKEKLSESGLYCIESASEIESTAFASVIVNSIEKLASRALYVNDDQILFDSGQYPGAIIFITSECSIPACQSAVSNGHVVVICRTEYDNNDPFTTVKLERIDKYKLLKALVESGITDQKAKEVTDNSFGELRILLHLLNFDQYDIFWNKLEDLKILLPAILLGSWNENFEGDKTVLELLADCKYEEYLEKIAPYVNRKDSPIIHIGSTYKLKYHGFAHSLLGKEKMAIDFEMIQTLLEFVFLEKDPHLKLSHIQRAWLMSRGEKPQFSPDLKKYMLYSLIHIVLNPNHINAQTKADSIVQKLLEESDSEILMTNHNYFKLFAEVSPKSFLNKISNLIDAKSDIILDLFKEKEDWFMPDSRHADLLWALESLAWIPDYFEDAVTCLMGLAKLDPGGQLRNRPANSLRAIYFIWGPNTFVDQNDRIEVLKRVANKYPGTTIKLLCSLLNMQRSVFNSNVFEFRHENSKNSTTSNPLKALEGIFSILSEHESHIKEESRLQLLQTSMDFPVNYQDQILKWIKSNFEGKDPSTKLYNFLGRLISVYSVKEIGDTNVDRKLVKSWIKIYDEYRLKFPLEEMKSAYSAKDSYLRGAKRMKNLKEENEFRQKLRLKLIKKYLNQDMKAIQELIRSADRLRMLGTDLALHLKKSSHLEFLKQYLTDSSLKELVLGFCRQIKFKDGEKKLRKLFNDLVKAGYSIENVILIACTWDNSLKLWEEIESYGIEAEKIYWSNMHPYFESSIIRDINYMINKLLKYDRNEDALWMMCRSIKDIDTEALINFLFGIVQGKIIIHGGEHNLRDVISELYSRDLENFTDKMISIELGLYGLISLINFNEKFPKILGLKLSYDPRFLVDVLKSKSEAFMPDTSSPKISERLYSVMSDYKQSAILNSGNENRYDEFRQFGKKVRELATNAGILNHADQLLGELLGGVPKSENWPDDEICNTLNFFKSEDINFYFISTASDGKGVNVQWTSKGGRERRAIRKSEQFLEFSDRIKFKYPKISKMLRDKSDSYKLEAESMKAIDEEQELRRGY